MVTTLPTSAAGSSSPVALTPWPSLRVLLTGAGGFIGSHLAERLVCAGARVRNPYTEIRNTMRSAREAGWESTWQTTDYRPTFALISVRNPRPAIRNETGPGAKRARVISVSFGLIGGERIDVERVCLGLDATERVGMQRVCLGWGPTERV